MSDEYEVGYGKPPKASQFKKGQSGNRAGRPRTYKSAISLLEEPVEYVVGGKRRTVTAFEASLRKTAQSALEGRLPAIKRFIGYCEKARLLDDKIAAQPGGVIAAPKGIDHKDWLASNPDLDKLARERDHKQAQNRPKQTEPEQIQIIKKVAMEKHFIPAFRRKLTIFELVQKKLMQRALKDRHEPSHIYWEKLLLKTMQDIDAPRVGYIIAPTQYESLEEAAEAYGLQIEDVDDDTAT